MLLCMLAHVFMCWMGALVFMCRERGHVRRQVAAVLLGWGEFCCHYPLASVGALPLHLLVPSPCGWHSSHHLSLLKHLHVRRPSHLSSKVAPPHLHIMCRPTPLSSTYYTSPLPSLSSRVAHPHYIVCIIPP